MTNQIQELKTVEKYLIMCNILSCTWLFSKNVTALAGCAAGVGFAHTGTHSITQHRPAVVVAWPAMARALFLKVGLQRPLQV